jgi:hypothetical protein
MSGIGFNPFFPCNRRETAVGPVIGGLPYGEGQYSIFLRKGVKKSVSAFLYKTFCGILYE